MKYERLLGIGYTPFLVTSVEGKMIFPDFNISIEKEKVFLIEQMANKGSVSYIEPFNEATIKWSKRRNWKNRIKNLQNSIK